MPAEMGHVLLAGGDLISRGQQTSGGIWFELGALVPSIGVGLLFWFAIRAILRADRAERKAERDVDAALRKAERERRLTPESDAVISDENPKGSDDPASRA